MTPARFFFFWVLGVVVCLALLRAAVRLLTRQTLILEQMEGKGTRLLAWLRRPFSFFSNAGE